MGAELDYMCESARGIIVSQIASENSAWGRSHLAVLCDDAHSEVEGHVYQEEGVWEDVEALPRQPAVAVQEGDLHGDPDQVEEGDGHHAHDVVTPAGSARRDGSVDWGDFIFVWGHCRGETWLTARSLCSLAAAAATESGWFMSSAPSETVTAHLLCWGLNFSARITLILIDTVPLFRHRVLNLHANDSKAAWI